MSTSAPELGADTDRTLSDALATAAVVEVAHELGLLDALSGSPVATSGLAARLGTDPQRTRLLIDALVGLGLVTRHGDELHATHALPAASMQHRLWDGLAEAVRSGAPTIDVRDLATAEQLYEDAVPMLDRFWATARSRVAGLLAGFGPEVLDLGAGSAPWTRALARSDPSLHVTAVDLPGVLAVTRAMVDGDGLGDRFTLVAGDVFGVALDGEFDLAVLAAVCRLFGEDDVVALLGRVASVLRPGGTLAIVDALPDTDRDDGATNALYALGLSLRTGGGGVHTLDDYRRWLERTGFTDLAVEALDVPEISLLLARRAS